MIKNFIKILFILFIAIYLKDAFSSNEFFENEEEGVRFSCNNYHHKCFVDPDGVYVTKKDCIRNCKQDTFNQNYSCVNGECVIDMNGVFTDIGSCKTQCFPPYQNYAYLENECVPTNIGSYISYDDCVEKTGINRDKMRYKCDYNTFQCVQDAVGEYQDKNSCEMSCFKDDEKLYTCDHKSGNCVENTKKGYKKKSDCELNCSSEIPKKYYCNIDTNQCMVDNQYGSYITISDCLQNSVCSK